MKNNLDNLIDIYGDISETLPILGIGCRDTGYEVLTMFVDYDNYYSNINKYMTIMGINKYIVGDKKKDYDIMTTYNIDKDTHLHNVWKYKKWKENEK